jgi:hypothetical protein
METGSCFLRRVREFEGRCALGFINLVYGSDRNLFFPPLVFSCQILPHYYYFLLLLHTGYFVPPLACVRQALARGSRRDRTGMPENYGALEFLITVLQRQNDQFPPSPP